VGNGGPGVQIMGNMVEANFMVGIPVHLRDGGARRNRERSLRKHGYYIDLNLRCHL